MEASPSTDTAAVAAAPVGATPATGDVSLETPAAATIDAATQSAATSTGGSAPAAPALPETLIQLSDEQAAKILRQVEFYFSDSNLPRDKFMLEKMEGDGMVSLALLCSFARMRDHLGVKRPGDAMPPGTLGAVAAVLRKSQTLRLSDDGTQVGRVTKLGEVSEVQAAMDRRTLHAQPFPYNASLEDISAFFADFGEVKSVRMRRLAAAEGEQQRCFSGRVFVEFASEEQAAAVAAMSLVANGAPLRLEPKSAVPQDDLEVARDEGPAPFARPPPNAQSKNFAPPAPQRMAPGERKFTRGAIIAFTLKKETEDGVVPMPAKKVQLDEGEDADDDDNDDEKGNVGAAESAKASNAEGVAATGSSDVAEAAAAKTRDAKTTEAAGTAGEAAAAEETGAAPTAAAAAAGAAAEAEGPKEGEGKTGSVEKADEKMGEAEAEGEPEEGGGGEGRGGGRPEGGVTREDIKSALQAAGNIKFVDFSAGQVAGFVRFEHAHEAERALQLAKAMDPKCVKVGADGTTYAFLRLLDGEEEQEYWTKLREGQDRRHEKFGGGFRGGRGGGQRGGRKGGRGGGRGGRDNGYGGGGGGRGHKRFRAGEN